MDWLVSEMTERELREGEREVREKEIVSVSVGVDGESSVFVTSCTWAVAAKTSLRCFCIYGWTVA